jgi:pimeloyl-ACP methyl ester carboxylesterase
MIFKNKLILLFTCLCSLVQMNCSNSEKKTPILKLDNRKSIQLSMGNISYTDKGAGQLIILLHAAGHDLRDYDSIYNELAKSYRVIALDWIGHGMSDYPTPLESISAVVLANTLQEFVIKLNLPPSILIGNSVGAFSAGSLAISNPDKVKALVLVDSGGFIEIDTKTKLFCKFKGTEFWTGVLWNLFPSYYLKQRNEYVKGILENIKNNKSDKAISVNAAIWRSFVSPDHDLRERAKNIQAPTLLVWGNNDPVIPFEIGKKAEKIIPNSKLMILETGHIPFAEDPEGFLKIVIPFLNKVSINKS